MTAHPLIRRLLPALIAVTAFAAFASPASAAPSAIETSPYASCYLESGGAYCWTGSNSSYEYSEPNGAPYNSSPTLFQGLTSGVTDLALSSRHGCAVISGAAKCWGVGYWGAIGNPDFYDSEVAGPVSVTGLTSGVTDVAVGDEISCAVVSAAVKCWGSTSGLEVGDYSQSVTPVAVPQVTGTVAAVEAGDQMACAIASGGVRCWGAGYLGNGTESDNGSIASVTGLSDSVSKLSVSGSSACAIRLGALKCWGDGANGYSGNGSSSPSLSPITPTGLGSGVTDVSVGPNVICAVVSSEVKCWGSGEFGQLGDASSTESATPVAVPGTTGATAVSTTYYVACALVSGTTKCWGNNERGLLGDGVMINSFTPASLPALASGVTDIAAGWSGGCAVVSGTGKCWGNLQLPLSEEPNDSFSAADPTTVPGLESGVTSIDADIGDNYQDSGCATVSAAIKCWTSGSPTVATTYPGSPSGASGVSYGGFGSACAVISGGAQCWGAYDDEPDFVPLAGATTGVTEVSDGSFTHCAVVSGAGKCWGSNTWGQLGDGTYDDSPLPQTVPGMASGVTSISTSGSTTCAAVNGAAKCWGEGESAQLGDGQAIDNPNPVQVTGLTSGVTSVAVSSYNACAVKDGDAYCWGAGSSGEMGDDNKYGSTIPVKATGLPSTVTQVDSGLEHNCAIAGGGAYCWGANTYGQLGTGTTFGLRGPTTTAPVDDFPAAALIYPTAGSVVNSTSVPVEYASANGAEITCKLDDNPTGPCPSSYTGLSDGEHRVRLAVTNSNEQFTFADSYFEVDTTAPRVKIFSPLDGSTVTTSTPALYFEIEDWDYSYVTCTLDGVTLTDEDGWEDCEYFDKLPRLSVGNHTLVVTAVDYAGNASSATSNFTYGAASVAVAPARQAVTFNAGLTGKTKKTRKSLKVTYQLKFATPTAERAAGCKGSVQITTRIGKKKRAAQKPGVLKLDGKVCRMKAAIKFPRSAAGKRVTFDSYFPGNNVFLPAHSIKTIKLKR